MENISGLLLNGFLQIGVGGVVVNCGEDSLVRNWSWRLKLSRRAVGEVRVPVVAVRSEMEVMVGFM